jgi:hypothetical protein
MAKGLKKPNPRGDDGKGLGAEADKKTKIAKRSKAADKPAKKSNPSGAASKGQKLKRTPNARNYFTVGDDLQILEAWKASNNKPISNLAKELSATLHRSEEAVRDRLKRYIKNLSAAEHKELAAHGKRNPKWFVHFKGDKNDKKKKSIEKVAEVAPALHNREFNRKPRVSKKKTSGKPGKKVSSPDEKFAWVVDKLQNKDAYFKLEFSVQLLSDILNVLIQNEGVSQAEVERHIAGIHCDQTLGQILDGFRLKK